MAKGEDGFIWIATEEGLCRFDGLQVRVFQRGQGFSTLIDG
jgi:ligand-binding sensor domain-containing protein